MLNAVAAMVLVIWQLTVDPDRRDEFIEMTAENINESREYEGNIQFDIFVDEEQLDSVVFIERWESEEIRQAYMAYRAERGDIEELQAYLTSPPVISLYRQAVE